MTRRYLPLLGILLLVVAIPIMLQPRQQSQSAAGEETLVIITPHKEAICSEFGQAFARDFERRTGRRVRVDWRTPGGTSEIARYVRAGYLASFRITGNANWPGAGALKWKRLGTIRRCEDGQPIG